MAEELKCYNCGKTIKRGSNIFCIPWPRKEEDKVSYGIGQMEQIVCAECAEKGWDNED